MEAVAEQKNNPITYPERIYNGKEFVPNLNREQSSDNLTTVLTDKNEVLGFDDHTSQQEIEHAIDADRNGSISEYKPSFYDKFIRKPLADMGMSSFQPTFVSDIKPSPVRAFATAFARGATADIFKPPQSENEAQAFPGQAMAGSLIGGLASFATGGALLDGWKMTQLTPFAEGIIKSGVAGGAYKAVSETSNELRDSEHPDLAKIGEGVLHDTLWFGAMGATAPLSKVSNVSASAGLGYLMAKSEGQDEPSSLLNGALFGGIQVLHAHGDSQEVREMAFSKIQDTISSYISTKNPMVHPVVADQAAREMISNYAQDVLDRHFSRTPQEPLTPEELEQQKMLSEGSPIDAVVKDKDLSLKAFGALTADVHGIDISTFEGEGGAIPRVGEPEGKEPVLEDKNATSVISYVKDGKKFYTKLTSDELKGLTDEVKNIPTPPEGESQIHLDAITPNLTKNGTEISRDEFVKGHSQAGNILEQEEIAPTTQKKALSIDQGQTETEKPNDSIEGTGEVKTSGLSKSIENKAIKDGLVEDLGDLPSYKERDMDKIAEKVSEFINNDYELAKKIALGEAPEQDGLRQPELFTGIRIKAEAEGDVNTIRELALSDKASALATEAGQRVKALDSNAENSPIDAIREVKKSREPKKNNKKEVDNDVKEIQKQIKKSKPKIEDWNSFIDSIEC